MHVIFPDKHTIQTDRFPIKHVLSIGDKYYNKLDTSIKKYVIWLIEKLKENSSESYYPFDTHLSDTDSLHILELILKHVDMDFKEYADMLLKNLHAEKWNGDLCG